jgi:ATP-binding cassette subfamily B (MDR/TAP) protein 1
MTFIVGRSGSGKSTIGCLIAKFYEPTTGNITIDGHPFQALDPKWINEHITLVQQTSVLFNDTFFNNVACGHKVPGCISAEKVLAACSDVMLQPTISALPQGIDTNVGPEGHTLSGGEKQRLALARARLRNPPVLILDEVTSGLDPINREMVMTSLRKWRRGKTTIVITHDFSQIDENDFVYVFNSSVLVQEGFKRNLRGEKDDRAISGTGIEERKRKGGPSLTIMVTPPDHPGNSSETLNISPDTPVFPSRSARLTDRFLSGFTARGNQHRISHRMSLGIHPDYARRSRIEQAGAGSDMSKWPWVVRGAEPNDFNDERSRFSKYVSKRFLLEDFKDIELSPISCHQTIDLALPSPTSLGTGPEARSESLRQSSDKSDSRLPDIVLVSQDEEDRSTPTQECTTDPFATPSEFDRPSPLVKAAQKQASLATILKTVWPVLNTRTRVTLMLGILVSMIGAASTPIFSYCFAQLLGVMTSPGDKLEKGTKWAVLILALAITDGAGWGGGRYLLERTAQAWVNSIRSEALRRILLQPKPWFERNKNSATRITECLDRNAEEMRNIVGKFIPIVISVVTMMSISVTWAFVVSWKLTLVSLAPLPAVMGAVKGYTLISGNWETKCNKGAQSASSSMAEIMTNIRVVRAFTLEEYFSNKYKTTVAETLSLGMRRAALTCGFYGLYQSLNYPMTALVFYYGTVLLATKRELSIAEVMQVVNFLLFSIGTSAGLLSSIPQLTIAQATASQMLGYIEMSTEPPEGHRGKQLAYPALPVSITNLEFFHPRHPQKQILYGTCFDINPAQCTAIVGPSGCGKSTIISLLLGLHPLPTPPHQTRSPISFSGVPYSKVDIECLRLSMGYVAQSPFLFPATIAENIAYGLPEDSPYRKPRDICRAAEDAGLHRWILSLPDGYNTFVGDGGQPMSGGQAQRLNIARALVRRPRLLVLDEPTSSLDTDNANIIRRTIRKLSAQGGPMGIVMVTHSRDMMRVADKIVVLGDGGVTLEQGTYDDLLRKGGAFTALIRNEERHSSLHALGID